MKRNRDGTYFIRYSDGDEEPVVDASLIRRVAGAASSKRTAAAAASDSEAAAAVFKLGAVVEARYSGRSQWLRGTVTGVHRDSSYDIRYTDSGEQEQRVPARLVRAAAAAVVQESEVESDAPHKLGAAVEARRSSTGKRSRCTVVAVHRDGSYDVRFADGDIEERIAARLVTATAASASGRAPSETEAEGHKLGAAVEARRAGGRTFSRATVTAVHRDGSYDVRFADGDSEQRLQPRLLRAASSKSHDSGGSDSDTAATTAAAAVKLLRVGAEVEARYKGRSAYLRGAVTAVHRDGSFDIRYATGEHEDRVAAQLVRPLHKRSSANSSDGGGGSTRSATSDSEDERSRSNAPLTVGAAVTGRYKGGSKSSAAPATLTAVHRDGTCDLRYASGKSETRVERRYVALTSSRRSGASHSPQRSPKDGSSSSSSSVYRALLVRVHSAVMARHSAGGLVGLREALKSKASRDSFGRRALLTGADWRVTLEGHLRLRITDSEQSAVLQRCSDKKGRIKLADFVTAVEQAATHSNDSAGHSSDSETEQQQQRSRRGSDASAKGASGASSDEQDSSGKGSSSSVKAAGVVLSRALRKQLQALCVETLRSGAAVAAFTACSTTSSTSSSSGATVKEAQLGRLLRKLQLEASAAERSALWSCLDIDEDGRVTLRDLLELLLCATSEDAARDTAAAHKRILAALQAAKGSAETAGQRLSAALRKADPKGSGFVSAKDLRRCLEKADAKGVSSDDAAAVARRLDPSARGHVHAASLLTWLCSGLGTAKVCAKAARLLQLAESGGSPLELALQALDKQGTHAVSAKAFRAALRQLGPALTHAQTCALTAEFAAGDDDDDDVDYRRFLALSDAPHSNGKSGNRSRSSSPSKQRRAAAGSGSESGSSVERGDKRASKRAAADSGSSDSEGSEQLALVSRHTRAALCALAERPGDALRKAFAAVAGAAATEQQQQQELVLTKPGQLRKLLRKLDLGLTDDTALNSLAECLDVDGDGRVTYGEFLEFTLGSTDSSELSALHARLSTDLAAKTAERNGKSNGSSKSNSSSKLSAGQVAARAFQKYDPGASGRLSAADFKRGLERLGCGELQQEDRALLLARFDPSESGEVQYEQFCAWAGSGCDSERAVAKVGRCLGLLKARGSSLKRVFAAMDTDGSGKLSARELHKALHKVSSNRCSSSSCSSCSSVYFQ
jgi:Ca2+-binding EF-hand superfamily protein